MKRSEKESIRTPKINIKSPDQRFILIFKEISYISFPPVTSPKIVRMIPKIENIAPIGILISSPIMLFLFYQKIIVNVTAIIPTIIARNVGF